MVWFEYSFGLKGCFPPEVS